MFRPRLTSQSILVVGAAALTAFGCARDIEIEPAPDPTAVVVAQFDPTNAIPVLQLVPSPTALAQKPDGTIDQDAVAPEDCEYPTAAQCLAFVTGWPTTALPTYYFTGTANGEGKLLDETTIADGIKLYEQTPGGLSEVAYQPVISAIPAPPAACQQGGNGSDPPRTYTAAEVPQGIQVVLRAALKPDTSYFVVIKSSVDGGLRDINGKVVEPSRLYALLNVKPEFEPIAADGTIKDGLLRSNVSGTVLAQRFGGRSLAELTTDEKAQYDQFYQASAVRLRGLYSFFNAVGGALETARVITDRKEAILMNTWRTGAAPATTIEFDPLAQKVPFPNVQLLTQPDPTDATKLKVALPPSATDSPTAAALKAGLNTLDGFSTTAPMVITASDNLDVASLTGKIVMYPVNDQGAPDSASPVPLTIGTSTKTATSPFTITIRPTRPLAENQNYVVAVLAGSGEDVLKDANGKPVVPNSTFNFLKIPGKFIEGEDLATLNPALLRPLQCSTLQDPTKARLATDAEVIATAQTLENSLQHPRWLSAFESLEMLSTPVPRTNVIMAWNHKTQSISSLVQTVKTQLLPGVWEPAAAGPRVVGPVATYSGTSSIAALVGVVPRLCVPICQAGEMEPAIARDACVDGNGAPAAAVATNPICALAVSIVAGRLERADLYFLRTYRATTGSPYTSGTFTPTTIMTPAVENIPFWVIRGTVPNGTTVPAEGYPVAIFQHGLGQVKESGFYIANTLARINANANQGWATVLMDLPFHGARASDLTRLVNGNEVPCVDSTTMLPNVNPDDVTCDFQTRVCTGGCDNVQDSSGTGFLSTNVFSARDNFRQSTIDQLTLLRAIQQESDAGEVLEFLDGARVGYIGQSLGAITGGNFAAYATPAELDAAVLNVGGGSLTTILINTVPQISAGLFAALAQAGVCEFKEAGNPASGCKPTPAFNQFLLTAQWALDPGDPLATSVNVTKAGGYGVDNVLMQMSLPDPVVTNLATYALAYSGYGIPPGNNRLQIYDFTTLPNATVQSGCHGFILAPTCGACLVDTLCNTLGAQEQAALFLETDAQTIAPPRPLQVAGFPCENACQ